MMELIDQSLWNFLKSQCMLGDLKLRKGHQSGVHYPLKAQRERQQVRLIGEVLSMVGHRKKFQ